MEVVLKYKNDPMQLADNVVLAKETIRAVARQCSMKALFLPKYNMMQAGNGLHLHVSVRDATTDRPLFSCDRTDGGRQGLSGKASSFLEGILQQLPACMGITLPTNNSFKRVGVGCWTGSQVGWAIEDKESAIRICSNLETQELDHVEYKLCDSTCNIYMALAAVLASGLDGISRGAPLRPSLRELEGGPRDDATSSKPESLPTSLDESLRLLETNEVLRATFGPSLLKGYLALRRNEAERSSKMTLEEQVQEALKRT